MKVYSQDARTIILSQYDDPLLNHISKHILSNLSSGEGKTLLDIGCGIGRLVFAALEKGYQVVGVDIEPKVISIAKKDVKEKGLENQCSFYLGDFLKIKHLSTMCFDAIICSEVIEHVENPQAIADFAYKLLKPGGIFLLSTPHDPSQWTILDDYGQHIQRFTEKNLRKIFYKFQILTLYTVGFPFMRGIMQIYHRLSIISHYTHSGTWRKNSTINTGYNTIVKMLLKIDDIFNSLKKGTNLIIMARKRS